MKRRITVILTALILALMLASCGMSGQGNSGESAGAKANGNSALHTLYFKDVTQREDVRAVFYNSNTKETAEVKMTASGEDSDGFVYTCEGDASAYNMVKITYGDKHTKEFAFNKCVSGWYDSKDGLLPYTEGEEISYPAQHDEITLTCNGYEKEIHIFKPDDYDADSQEKYASVYVLDGQWMTFLGKEGISLDDSCLVTEQVKAMTSVTGSKAIVSAVDTYGNMKDVSRDVELAPDLSKYGAELDREMKGNEFAAFVADTLVPYVQEHYNVYTDALHTSIAGASLSGLESFYITMEYPELFGTVGALSPSFLYYDNDEMWRKYLGEKTFDDNSPVLYFYTGPQGGDTDPFVTDMVNRLKDLGYPSDKLILHYNENGGHHVWFWRSVFSEFLEAMVFRSVKPLQQP
jgi:predicted alpha/beta superfamily hydrolase